MGGKIVRKFVLAALLCAAPLVQASAEELRLGFISILSGQLALLGEEQKRGFDVALEALGGKVGGVETKVFVADNKGNPGDAVQEATKLIDRDKVQIVTGFAASHTTMAALKPLLAAEVISVGANAGPSPLAGKGCNKNWFSTGFHNDQWDMAMGQYMTQKGLKRVYFMGMDYQAGWDHVKAAIREFKGEKAGEVYTPIAQMDFSAELTQLRAAKPDAVFVFYVGPNAVAFLKQYTQAGLAKTIPLYSMGAISDPLLYKAQGDAALGLVTTEAWNTELDNPANKKFVAAFRKKFGRDPTGYAARQYDAVMLIDSAVRQVKGNLADKDALRAALRKGDFQSVRGDFRFNTNQYPILNVYVQEVSKRANGEMYQKLTGVVVKDIKDPDYVNCKM
jgi:branched-chain amino acid transport system substrate-binding protein